MEHSKTFISTDTFNIGFGALDSEKKLVFRPHSHTSYEALFITKGNLTYNIEGRTYKIKENDLILTPPGKHHYLIKHEGTKYYKYYAMFQKSVIPAEILAEIPPDVDVVNFKGNENALRLFNTIHEYHDNMSEEAQIPLLKGTIWELVTAFSIAAKKQKAPKSSSTNPIIERAIQYVGENIERPITVEDICRDVYITKSHLHHLFVENLRTTPKKYVLEKQLMRAQRHIMRGEKPTDVYRECGFTDYTSFYRNYKTYFGYSPSHAAEHGGLSIYTPEDEV